MNPVPLHLKYRPQSLSELVGQPLIQTCLTNALVSGQLAPAYLFVGVRGTGKTSTARIMAKSLNCLEAKHPTVTPCGRCQSCRAIEASRSLDVTEIDAASHGGVDDARDLVQTIGLAPMAGRYRVIVIDEAHMLTTQSQNALLKCIEEPPAHVVFILCTTEPHKILPTITSRCLLFEFRRVSVAIIATHLEQIAHSEGITLSREGAEAIARLCDGGLRDGLQLLAKAALLDGTITAHQVYELAGMISEAEVLEILDAISHQDALTLLQTARSLIDSGKKPAQVHRLLLETYKDLLIVQHTPEQANLFTSPIATTTLKHLANQWHSNTLQQGLKLLHEAEGQLRFSPNDQTWLEVLLLNLVPQFADAPTPTIVHKRSPTKSDPVQGNGNGLADPNQVWQQVLANAPPKAKALLSTHAQLTNLKGGQAVLVVTPAKADAIKRNAQQIGQMLTRVTGTPIKIRIQVPSSVN